jgi:hypothetical protein
MIILKLYTVVYEVCGIVSTLENCTNGGVEVLRDNPKCKIHSIILTRTI